ncbi:serine--tRNA ligase [Pasteuria penetrans]|uniref:serine--tRNA ligase n=1 Tax=Pasteuria penetrans TaxID=86005 RepID=UPI000FC17ACC|nr:serine--tRNA ligase [Pasteuria penetrans]
MLDIKSVRKDEGELRRRFLSRGLATEVWDQLIAIDHQKLRQQQEVEQLRHRRRQLSESIAARHDLREELAGEIKEVSHSLRIQESVLRETEESWLGQMLSLPNLPDASVPMGRDAADNVVVRTWGQPPTDAKEPHWEMGARLGWIDTERAAKVTGARFAFTVGVGARLERVLAQWMLDVHTRDHGYKEIAPPFIVHERSLLGTGNFPKFREDVFRIGEMDHYLLPTAEVPITNYHRESILTELPCRYVAYTPCFRSEAGAAGRDTKGLIRLHQFQKVELVQFVDPDASGSALEEMTSHAERILQLLELPYRVVSLCTGDLGFSAAKTYDLEVWLPSAGTYCEVSSCSNCKGFQARRAGIRFRSHEREKSVHVHTLNGSALPIGRTMASFLECHSRSDGSIYIPPVLRPYWDGQSFLRPPL